MEGILKVYNLPGKLLAELWYLWPKKGQIWASGRRRDHGFVHFMYSTVFYAIAAFFIFGGSGERRANAGEEVESAALYSGESDEIADSTETYEELEETEPTFAEEAVEEPLDEPAPSGIVFESNPVVQGIPVASEGQDVADAPVE